ncbi:glycosyltransferase family 39 protein [Desulfuromonas thiophila]|uniref:4-amino-4-deoxy-L-arabinose transferase n=1 Tax=Desulfuromonas thiophila TaxID=57664 RepID=A0A1G7ESA6_9BACT|nr:glycosyltransferase family 39 protein [Desulfuromonas thiophila]SDE66550.1 4-amino-4-deoxy-L-arabinose transferase [Desulfuromonas thiophila]
MSSTASSMPLRRNFQIIFIFFVCLGLYYPAIFNTTLTIDDVDVVRRMQDATFDWWHLFAPRSSFYYRPLIILTYWVDKWLWDFTPSFMLLENVLLHSANAILIFFISENVFKSDNSTRFLPFVSAFIFAIHPIATESVNWMSGRSDLLASFFVLLAVLFLFKALKSDSWWFLTLSFGFFVCGICSKEIVVFFLPAAAYLIFVWNKAERSTTGSAALRLPWGPACFYTLPVFFGGAGYFLLRAFRHAQGSRGISSLIERIPYEGLDLVRVVFKVFGFYVKKIFIPQPLNFAIVEANDLYVLLGLVIFGVTVYLVKKPGLRWSFFLISLYLITPAILIAITGIAWTPLAERYVYLPAAFMSVGIVSGLKPLWLHQKYSFYGLVLLLCWAIAGAFSTTERSILWQDKEAFYADAIRKSPNFNKLKNEYGLALLASKKKEQALEQFQLGQKNKGSSHSFINEVRYYVDQGDLLKAREILLQRYPAPQEMNERTLRLLVLIDARRLRETESSAEKKQIYENLLETYAHLFKKTKDAHPFYRSGQIALRMGDVKKAQSFFEQAYQKAPESAHYKSAAGKMAEKLRAEAQ